jgi:pilus assembly protein Flp/PilA
MFAFERLYIAVVMHFADVKDRHEKGERGAAMVEYGLLIAFIAVIALVAVKVLGTKISTLFSNIAF